MKAVGDRGLRAVAAARPIEGPGEVSRVSVHDMAISRLLLVEDSRRDAQFIRKLLEAAGGAPIEVVHVESMTAAIHRLEADRFDVVLLDLGLPDAQGTEAVRRALEVAPLLPMVVLTGLEDEQLADRVLAAGAQEHLIKGEVDARGLLRAIRYAIERKSMQVQHAELAEAMFAEKERAHVTLASIGEAVACTDMLANITFLNVAAEVMTGWSAQDATGKALADVFCLADGATGAPINMSPAVAKADNRVQDAIGSVLVRRDGTRMPIDHSVAAIHDRSGQVVGAVRVFRDVAAAREIARQMAHCAEHDFLTGLPNRMLLLDRVTQAIAMASRREMPFSILFLDLNGFKHINDSLGHHAGDKLLQSVARRLVSCVRPSDTVSRQGGDEFVILLHDLPHFESAAVVADRVLQGVASVHAIDQHNLHVTASIGVSVYPDDGKDAETLIRNADTAMYQAKTDGQQSYCFFTPSMNARATARHSIEEAMRNALERNEFTLHYQPKINVHSGAITGAEALIRWSHPERGQISPAEFLPVAEECGLIVPIGRWVLREACRQAVAWAREGLSIATIAVNISAVEFGNENFLESVFSVLTETGLDPSCLDLELTEGVLMKHAETSATILSELRQAGVQLAVDDFGSGYSSLSCLRTFPLSALKIDQSFIRQITTVPQETAIVEAVIGMARSLRLSVVAEGVEAPEELEFLRRHQCTEAQGYLISRPLPPDSFAAFIAADPRERASRAAALRYTEADSLN